MGRTSKKNTKEVIMSIYGRTNNKGTLNTFDSEYFQHIVEITTVNDEKLYRYLHKGKPLSVAKSLICSIVNLDLKYQGYETVCTYNQIRQVLQNEFDCDIRTLEASISKWIEEERKELEQN